MAGYTCIACRVAFHDPDTQRSHYKTDWHRYNLKRKVAELPPVTVENFNERVLAQQAEAAAQSSPETSDYCRICTKKFNTKHQFENHLLSKKHRTLDALQERRLQDELVKLQEKNKEKGIDITNCEDDLRSLAQKNLENKSLKEPATSSGDKRTKSSRAELFGDDPEDGDDVDDTESVESWEGEALGLEQCLFCDSITDTFEKNVDHMTTRHSFFIPDLEYLVDLEGLIAHLGEKVGLGNMCLWCNDKGRVYGTTKSCQQHMVDKGHCKLLFDGDAALEYADYYDYRSSYPDYKPGDADRGDDDDEEVEPDLLAEDNYQLALPSGATIGHRSLMRYYRQKLVPVQRKKQTSLTKVMAHYRALGWNGDPGAVEKRVKDMGYLQRMKAKHYLKLATKQNKFQPHFRQQVMY